MHKATWLRAAPFIFRFILGLGIGGDYHVSAILMSEYSDLIFVVVALLQRSGFHNRSPVAQARSVRSVLVSNGYKKHPG